MSDHVKVLREWLAEGFWSSPRGQTRRAALDAALWALVAESENLRLRMNLKATEEECRVQAERAKALEAEAATLKARVAALEKEMATMKPDLGFEDDQK